MRARNIKNRQDQPVWASLKPTPKMFSRCLNSKKTVSSPTGTFKSDTFEKDKNSILDFYKNQGFLDVELEDARYDYRWKNPKTQEERVIVITYKVKEGDQYFYNGYDVTWDERFLNPTTKKQLFSRDKIEEFFEYTTGDVGSVLDNGKF
jgi:outer membrane protein insertion porin family